MQTCTLAAFLSISLRNSLHRLVVWTLERGGSVSQPPYYLHLCAGTPLSEIRRLFIWGGGGLNGACCYRMLAKWDL